MLTVDDLNRKFVLDEKQINLDITDCLVNGLLDAKDLNGVLNLNKVKIIKCVLFSLRVNLVGPKEVFRN